MAETVQQQLMKLLVSVTRTEEQVKQIRLDQAEAKAAVDLERQESHMSRKEIHEKLDQAGERFQRLETSMKITADTTAQTRDIVDKQVLPVIVKVRGWEKRWGLILSVATVLGAGLWYVLYTNINTIWAWAKSTFGGT